MNTNKVPVSLMQFDAIPLESKKNLKRITKIAKDEAKLGAKIIVFPELVNTGYVEPLAPGFPFTRKEHEKNYSSRLFDESEPINGDYCKTLAKISKEFDTTIIIGLATRHPVLAGVMYNSSVMIMPNGKITIYNKIHRWQMEKLYFNTGENICVEKTPVASVGMQVCYDIRFPELTRSMTLQGAEIVTNIWASFRHISETDYDPNLFIHRIYTRAVENGIFMLSCNRVGRHGDFQFMGRSCVIAPNGEILAQSTSEEEEIIRAELDLADINRYRSFAGILNDRRPDLYHL